MKKIGVITDAHANLPALTAALAMLDQEGCDFIVHSGDAIGIGPHPAEVLETLLHRPNTSLLMGNHDEWFVLGLPEPRPSWMSAEEWDHQVWTHQQLTPAMRDAVAAWPYTLDVSFEGTPVTFCHYARGQESSGFASVIKNPEATDLDRLFSESMAEIVFYGHHHPVSDLRGRARYVNPGALGCNPEFLARFAVLEKTDNDMVKVRLGSVPYDPHPLLRDFERRSVPARATILETFFGKVLL